MPDANRSSLGKRRSTSWLKLSIGAEEGKGHSPTRSELRPELLDQWNTQCPLMLNCPTVFLHPLKHRAPALTNPYLPVPSLQTQASDHAENLQMAWASSPRLLFVTRDLHPLSPVTGRN